MVSRGGLWVLEVEAICSYDMVILHGVKMGYHTAYYSMYYFSRTLFSTAGMWCTRSFPRPLRFLWYPIIVAENVSTKISQGDQLDGSTCTCTLKYYSEPVQVSVTIHTLGLPSITINLKRSKCNWNLLETRVIARLASGAASLFSLRMQDRDRREAEVVRCVQCA